MRWQIVDSELAGAFLGCLVLTVGSFLMFGAAVWIIAGAIRWIMH